MRIISFISLLFFSSLSAIAQYVEPVKEVGKVSVLNNMVFMPREKLQPEWYHYRIWYTSIFGIKFPMIGLGLHHEYANTDMRNIKQLLPLTLTVDYTRQEAEVEHEKTDIVYKQELAKFADKTIDYQYTLTNNRRNDLIDNIETSVQQYLANNGSEKNAEIIRSQVERITANVQIIHESHMSNSKKREAYIKYENELKKVYSLILRLNSINGKITTYE